MANLRVTSIEITTHAEGLWRNVCNSLLVR